MSRNRGLLVGALAATTLPTLVAHSNRGLNWDFGWAPDANQGLFSGIGPAGGGLIPNDRSRLRGISASRPGSYQLFERCAKVLSTISKALGRG